jgi:hypothetical protein
MLAQLRNFNIATQLDKTNHVTMRLLTSYQRNYVRILVNQSYRLRFTLILSGALKTFLILS